MLFRSYFGLKKDLFQETFLPENHALMVAYRSPKGATDSGWYNIVQGTNLTLDDTFSFLEQTILAMREKKEELIISETLYPEIYLTLFHQVENILYFIDHDNDATLTLDERASDYKAMVIRDTRDINSYLSWVDVLQKEIPPIHGMKLYIDETQLIDRLNNDSFIEYDEFILSFLGEEMMSSTDMSDLDKETKKRATAVPLASELFVDMLKPYLQDENAIQTMTLPVSEFIYTLDDGTKEHYHMCACHVFASQQANDCSCYYMSENHETVIAIWSQSKDVYTKEEYREIKKAIIDNLKSSSLSVTKPVSIWDKNKLHKKTGTAYNSQELKQAFVVF